MFTTSTEQLKHMKQVRQAWWRFGQKNNVISIQEKEYYTTDVLGSRERSVSVEHSYDWRYQLSSCVSHKVRRHIVYISSLIPFQSNDTCREFIMAKHSAGLLIDLKQKVIRNMSMRRCIEQLVKVRHPFAPASKKCCV